MCFLDAAWFGGLDSFVFGGVRCPRAPDAWRRLAFAGATRSARTLCARTAPAVVFALLMLPLFVARDWCVRAHLSSYASKSPPNRIGDTEIPQVRQLVPRTLYLVPAQRRGNYAVHQRQVLLLCGLVQEEHYLELREWQSVVGRKRHGRGRASALSLEHLYTKC